MVIVGLGWSFMVIDGHFMQMPLQEANTPVRKKGIARARPKGETRNTEYNPRTPGHNVDQSLRNSAMLHNTHPTSQHCVLGAGGYARAIPFFGRACRFHDHQGPSMIVTDHQ